MKKILLFLAAILMLGSANQVSAQLIIRNNGHAELGTNPNLNDGDESPVLKIFGDETNNGAGGKITFGDSTYVSIGEKGATNTDQLWLHGRNGMYFTARTLDYPVDTIVYFNSLGSCEIHFNYDVSTSGIFVQSDERYKENVEPVRDVLGDLMNLEPVTYNLKRRNGAASSITQSVASNRDIDQFTSKREQGSERYGFLAQNVKEVFPELVHTDMNGYMSVDYIGLIPILVQSINELRAELAAVKAEKGEDEAPVLASQGEISASLNEAKLYQNAPNPWNSETVIRYSLPQNVTTADIYIYDMQGTQLKRIPANGRGEAQITITAHDLKAGMYLYALVADGKLVDSKKMILTN